MAVHGAWMGASRNVRPDDDLMEIVVEVVTATTVLETRAAARLTSPLTQSRSVVAPAISNRTRHMVRPPTKKKLPADRKGLSSMTQTQLRTKCSKKGIDCETTLTGKPMTCDQMRRKLRGWTPPVPTASGAASSGVQRPPAAATATGASSSGINAPIRKAGPKVGPMTSPRPTTTATMGMATSPMLSPAPHLMQLVVIEASEILALTSPMSVAGEQPTTAMPALPQFPTPAAASAEAEIAAQRAALTVEYERLRAMEEQLYQQQQITVQAQTDLQNQAEAAQMQCAQAHAVLQRQQAEVSRQQQANLLAAAIMQQRAAAAASAAAWPAPVIPRDVQWSARAPQTATRAALLYVFDNVWVAAVDGSVSAL